MKHIALKEIEKFKEELKKTNKAKIDYENALSTLERRKFFLNNARDGLRDIVIEQLVSNGAKIDASLARTIMSLTDDDLEFCVLAVAAGDFHNFAQFEDSPTDSFDEMCDHMLFLTRICEMRDLQERFKNI